MGRQRVYLRRGPGRLGRSVLIPIRQPHHLAELLWVRAEFRVANLADQGDFDDGRGLRSEYQHEPDRR